jgi:hypothetical protein
MGLLDDAIREHLELKRLRGVDPVEVAREQREALDPLPRDEHAASQDDVAEPAEARPISGSAHSDSSDVSPEDGAPVRGVVANLSTFPEATLGTERSDAGEETAELDMGSVLDQEQSTHHVQTPSAGPVAAGPPVRASAEGDTEEDSLAWEFPGYGASERAADPAQDRQGVGVDHSAGEEGVEAPLPAEDVLEETPDLLRDTPEQERLWFEQRPRRGLDFDE